MKRLISAVLLALVLCPAPADAVSLFQLTEPAVEPAPAEPEGAASRLDSLIAGSDEPVESKTGWFIGPMVWKVYLDFSALDPMTVDRGVSALQDDPFIVGIHGGIIRDHWRFGGLYVTGAQSSWDRIGVLNGATVEHEWRGARITFDAFGLFVDYDREYKTAMAKKYFSRVPYLRYGWLLGGILAYGRLGIEAEGSDLGPSEQWSTDENILILNPYLGLWVSPFDWIWAQVELGYIMIMMPDEQIEDDTGRVIMDGAIGGGPHLGFKLVFGSNPNFKVKVPPPR